MNGMEPPECFVAVFGVGLRGVGTGERVKERIYINNHCLLILRYLCLSEC